MRDRARIRKAADGKWLAIRPGYGFNAPENSRPLDSQRPAVAWLDGCRAHSESGTFELSDQARDGISSTPTWTPLWPR